MRFVELSMETTAERSPLGPGVARDPLVVPRAIHQLEHLPDDTAVAVYELTGSPDRVEAHLAAHDPLFEYELTVHEGSVLVYVHFAPAPPLRALLEVRREYGIVVDTPLRVSRDGTLHLTLIGGDRATREVLLAVPDSVAVSVERAGEYAPGTDRPLADLTERQREVLRAALEVGYYDEPRGATYADIAGAVDSTTATVGEHLRKAERALLTGLF